MMGPWWCRLRGHRIERDSDRIGPTKKKTICLTCGTMVGHKPATARLATGWRRLTPLVSSGPRAQRDSRGKDHLGVPKLSRQRLRPPRCLSPQRLWPPTCHSRQRLGSFATKPGCVQGPACRAVVGPRGFRHVDGDEFVCPRQWPPACPKAKCRERQDRRSWARITPVRNHRICKRLRDNNCNHLADPRRYRARTVGLPGSARGVSRPRRT